jgi:hypothetical protein
MSIIINGLKAVLRSHAQPALAAFSGQHQGAPRRSKKGLPGAIGGAYTGSIPQLLHERSCFT